MPKWVKNTRVWLPWVTVAYNGTHYKECLGYRQLLYLVTNDRMRLSGKSYFLIVFKNPSPGFGGEETWLDVTQWQTFKDPMKKRIQNAKDKGKTTDIPVYVKACMECQYNKHVNCVHTIME